MAKAKTTIYDIAKIASVSANTVSRVLNDKSGVSEATRTRIRRIINEVGYHPNIGARALRGGAPPVSASSKVPTPTTFP